MSHAGSSAEWQEPLTGPGVTVNHGYDFERVLRPLRGLFGRNTDTGSSEGAAIRTGTPPESSVLLAAKHRYEMVNGAYWADATADTQQEYLNSTRVMISSGLLLIKAKYLAKVGATSWTDYFPNE